jgi:hypothetical protein
VLSPRTLTTEEATMSEPLDPLAAGVASALKSLRARAGLQESRLAGGMALDTLVGLDSVRDLVTSGKSIPQAIIQAVSDAAATLEPTYSIVADASLGLGLSADDVPELYTGDLSSRREVLLRNWDRLHELRAVTIVERPPAPRALRIEVEEAALSALAAVLTGPGQSRAVPQQQPAPGRRAEASAGAGAPSRQAEAVVRAGQVARGGAEPRPAGARQQLIRDEFQRVARILRYSLITDADGTGWPQDLRKGSTPATSLSTSYGLKAMLMLEGYLAPDLIPVANYLKREDKDGGYSARSQRAPRPEAIADVLRTLHRLDGAADYRSLIGMMKDGLKPFDRTRPFILTSVLETSAQIGADAEFTGSLVTDLLAARQAYGDRLLWPEKAEAGLVAPVPSIVHTARAVCALAQVQATWSRGREPGGLDSDVREALADAVTWLAGQDDLGNVSEVVDRQFAAGVEPVYVRHFTAAWLVKALVAGGIPASHPTVVAATARIWRAYSPEAGLWRWRNGELPVWMTMDAIDALRVAALATMLPHEVSGGP